MLAAIFLNDPKAAGHLTACCIVLRAQLCCNGIHQNVIGLDIERAGDCQVHATL